jgi:hypothetical protein
MNILYEMARKDKVNNPKDMRKYFARYYGYHYTTKEWEALKKHKKVALKSKKINRR